MNLERKAVAAATRTPSRGIPKTALRVAPIEGPEPDTEFRVSIFQFRVSAIRLRFQRRDENLLKRQRFGRKRLGIVLPQALHQFGARRHWRSTPVRGRRGARAMPLSGRFPAALGQSARGFSDNVRGPASASRVSTARPRSMSVNSSINPSNSVMRWVETRIVRWPGMPCWYAPITASMNSRRTMGSRPEVGSSSTSRSVSGQTAATSATWVRWPLERLPVRCAGSSWKRSSNSCSILPVPIGAKRSEVIQRLANAHPRIERHLVRHVGERALHLHFVLRRIEAEHAHLPALRTEQIQQTLHGGGLARAIAPEEPVTAAGLQRSGSSHAPPPRARRRK